MAGPQTRNHTGTSQKQIYELPGTYLGTTGVAVIDDDGEENAENTEIEASIEEVVKIEAEVTPMASATLTPCSSVTTSYLTPLLTREGGKTAWAGFS